MTDNLTISRFTPEGVLRTVDEIVAEHMRLAIEDSGGNISAASKELGVYRRRLYRWKDRIGLDVAPPARRAT